MPRPRGTRARSAALAAALAALALAAGAAGPGSRGGVAGAATVADPGCGVMKVVFQPDVPTYRLPHTFLRAGSDTVRLRGAMLARGADYVIDPVRGELRLLRERLPGDTLEVAACWLFTPPPLMLQIMSYRPVLDARADSAALADSLRAAAAGRGATATRPATARDPLAAPAGAALVVSGNKSLAVDFGSSQDATLRQSLDLAVSGTLAPGVQLTGVLSDRNLPLTATGATQGLQSFDKVLIEMTAPQGSAALGDIGLSLQRGEFARLERRVQGVRGDVSLGAFKAQVAAANAQGEYRRMEFLGAEGRQGPYLLTDAGGPTGIGIVAGSETVLLDGARLTRGEGADYAIDYERARITFSNRRPISSESRITVDYQFTANRYRRNLAAVGGGWEWRHGYLFTQSVTESDDRGRPLDITLDASDVEALTLAGDSATVALAGGVTYGIGDYDTVRVAGVLAYAFAGPDAGHWNLQFTRASAGLGAYSDSALVAGRTVYRYVGSGNGLYRVGRALPLPESHQVWTTGGGARLGALALEAEGALSRRDLNTFSSRDDGDNLGHAARARASLEGATPWLGALAARAGLSVQARTVEPRFTAFSRLEVPFAGEDWGLPVSGDLEHQRRFEASAFLRPRAGGQLTASVGRLETPGGFESWRRSASWTREGGVTTRALWERADGTERDRRLPGGGRDHARAELRVRLRWLEPALRLESDERRSPSDEAALELASPRALRWHALAGATLRRDARQDGGGSYVDRSDARTLRAALDSPDDRAVGVGVAYQWRELESLDPALTAPGSAAPRSRSDLGSLRVRADDRALGLRGHANLELTSEGDNRRTRTLVFVGGGRGSYDAAGNFVSGGDYDLRVTISPDLERLSRAATSAHAEWVVPAPRSPWGGSRAGFDFESETRRRGDPELRDPVIAPAAALTDLALARGSVLQRLETELAPESPAAALRLRLERRVSADRTDENYVQTLDERQASVRWRTRAGGTVSTEVEGRWSRRAAAQLLAGGSGYGRTLLDQGGTAQLIYTPDTRLRAVAVAEATWSRGEGQPLATRTVRLGPDLGLALGARGRAETSLRRSFISGPPPLSLLPTLDPVGAPRWEVTSRLDYRVHETTTFGLSVNGQERPGARTLVTGRAELRAFF